MVIAPIIFSFVAVLLVLRGIVTAPWQGVFALLFTGATVAFYYVTVEKSRERCLGNSAYCDCLNVSLPGLGGS